MDFYQGQEILSSFDWILRAIVAFIFLVIVAKVLGQRAISQLRLLDFVIALVIGNIIAHPLSDQHLGMKGSIITTIVLVVLYSFGIFLILKWPWFRRLINHAPITIIENGSILYGGLKRARISLDVVLEELRENKVGDIKKVALAVWEVDGRISFFLDPRYEPVTPATLKIETEPFFLPKVIIKEGKINLEELKRISKDEEWVRSTLKRTYQADVADVLLATVDRNDHVSIFLYK
ncbi:DUF421 domain-containing protein [Neobacillus sp. YIM B06451]|uniref:DUF421 domain-containing protein n=1 Tax=Neobacillus sp. YIM B06451 TaxID=3070994 RepID=UPI002931CF09|nr:DUF421 domain-containing protein [Neobacillus sp. YIM B06451]